MVIFQTTVYQYFLGSKNVISNMTPSRELTFYQFTTAHSFSLSLERATASDVLFSFLSVLRGKMDKNTSELAAITLKFHQTDLHRSREAECSETKRKESCSRLFVHLFFGFILLWLSVHAYLMEDVCICDTVTNMK